LRITLLINIWLNRRPSDPIECPLNADRRKNNAEKSVLSPIKWKREELPCVTIVSSDKKKPIKMNLDKKRQLYFQLPLDHVVTQKSSSVSLKFEKSAAGLKKKEKKQKKDKKEKKKKKKK
jgi:hypothetical protein